MLRKSGLVLILAALAAVQTAPSMAQEAPPDVAEALQNRFAEVAKSVGPAVVSISTEVTERVRVRRPHPFGGSPFSEFEDDIFDRFFRDFFGDEPMDREFKQRGLGTGVLIDEEGYVLTNEHVIHGADKVTVTLPDGREFKGEIKGSDIRSDLAVVKISAKGLPHAELGDSDGVKIGQWAIAVGNPFGFAVGSSEPTVTVGVISALNRSIQLGRAQDRDYSNLIQTDAAINPGNSGGPLVNLKGEVIGVNVAIFSTTGGYQGIGFAIPSNSAKAVLGDLIEGKKVLYGWLGVNVQDVTEELAQHFKLPSKEGIIVARVLAGSPAEEGGLRDGDVVVSLEGAALKDVRELLKKVARVPVGQRIKLAVIRDGKRHELSIKVGQRPESLESWEARGEGTWRGLEVSAITPELAERYRLTSHKGVVVTQVEPNSPAEEAGLRVRDVILEINRQKVDSLNDFTKIAKKVDGDALVKTTRGYAVIRAR
ncbi:MAG: Do family serine endopeptidase [Candidatus Omnitrophica bacterium]|nr:Do family serine endopeptidase [Candidatus Omnitrophota bacterium]